MMRPSRLVAAALAICLAPCGAFAAEPPLELRSPDGEVAVTLSLSPDGAAQYAVAFRDREVIAPSLLGLDLGEAGALSSGFRIDGARRDRVDRRYALVAGKTRTVRDRYNALEVELAHADGRTLGLVLRAYDDGAALRYRIPNTGDTLVVARELTRFAFPREYACWALNLGRFGTSHEGEYDPISSSLLRPHHLIELPLVCRTGVGDTTFAIAEADLDRYAGLYLRGRGDGGPGVEAMLSPRLDTPDDAPPIAVRLAAEEIGGPVLETPWRAIMLGDSPGRLIESNLIANLNPPAAIADTGWIRPGKSAWDWWSGGLAADVADAGMNDATIRRYIDHAADLSLEYMLIDDGWYVGSSGDGRYHPDADITRAVPEIDLPGLVRYAGERGVGLWLWAHWRALDARMGEAFARYRALGIKGVKVDFMDRDDQQMVAFYHRLLASAARHRLMVNLHGAYHPTGLNRTWPNFLTQEGVLGAEYNKWTRRITARHNVTLPFTRMLLGPMDYTPGGFRNVEPGDFEPRHLGPLVMTTRAHQLAMFVVYESPLAVVADSPDAYVDAPGADFLRAVPATWDETRVLSGEIGEHVVIARRSGDDWYLGAMTDDEARTVRIPLDFLPAGGFTASLYLDGAQPDALRIETVPVDAGDELSLPMAASGGAALRLTPRAGPSRPQDD